MSVTRRDFLKLSGTVAAGAAAGTLSFTTGCTSSGKKTKGSKKKNIICPFCSLGCGLNIYVKKGSIVHVEGNPDHPVNEGSICAKASMISDLYSNDVRLRYVKYRKSGGTEWDSMSWDKALDMISDRICSARDASFLHADNGIAVNRTEGIAALAGGNLTNEEHYLFSKFTRLLGIPYTGNTSMIRSEFRSSAMQQTFGMSLPTNPWPDLRNADTVLIIGANPARSMPVVMRHIVEAKNRGARVITVDPLVTESASIADIHCSIRPGTDTAFVLGLIHYAIMNNRINRDYIIEYTDASYILKMDFSFDVIKALFSGFNPVKKEYSMSGWDYERDERGNPRKDEELRNMRTVYQTLKNAVSLYTTSYVSQVTGCNEEQFRMAADIFTLNFSPDKASAVVIGSGIEGHASSAQAVRALAILQMYCGNIGVSGGGILFGYASGNGAGSYAQIPGWNMLPGGIPLPQITQDVKELDLVSWIRNNTASSNDTMSINVRQYFKNHSISLLKSWFGDNAAKENRFAFDLLPKTGGVFSTRDFFSRMRAGRYKGMLLFGDDLSSRGAGSYSAALSALDWLVISDVWNTDSSEFWKNSGSPEKIKTEVFLLPSKTLFEKEGTVMNASRWIERLIPIPAQNNQVQSDLWIINTLFEKIRTRYETEGIFTDPIRKAAWQYGVEPDSRAVLKEICGISLSTKKALSSMNETTGDGDTACGNILFCGMTYKEDFSERTDNDQPSTRAALYPSWGWSVPSNVRILYNRASVDRKGKPWNKDKKVLDLEKNGSGPDQPHGEGAAYDKNPFIMNSEGVGRIFSGSVSDGPLPYHTEPAVSDLPFVKSPLAAAKKRPSSAVAVVAGTELSAASKNSLMIREWFPDGVCEMSPSFASAKGIASGDLVSVVSEKGSVTLCALVTARLRPLSCGGTLVDVVALSGRTVYMIQPDPSSSLMDEYAYIPVDISPVDKGGSK